MNRYWPVGLASILVGSACAPGTWALGTWGEAYVEQGIPTDAFVDGCAVQFDTFLVQLRERALLAGDGTVAGAIEGAQVFDLIAPGPHPTGEVPVPAAHYDTVRVRIGPGAGATPGNASPAQVAALGTSAYHIAGTLTCGEDAASFSWAFETDTTARCAPDGLTIPSGGRGDTELTVHADHLFYDALEDPDAVLRGRALLDADDGDGTLTLAELSAVSVADLGYDVGRFAEVTDLAAFVTALTRSFPHVDGEGHCLIDGS